MKLQTNIIYSKTTKKFEKLWSYKYKGYYIAPFQIADKKYYEMISPNYDSILRGEGAVTTLKKAVAIINNRIYRATLEYEKKEYIKSKSKTS
tara:strand:+ start:294 stop:569 length:276 start_codon:yes stop_codon:yes gene_type:complete